ncbi:hypothetical protein BFS86_19605 [Shewanella algae]|nr:hypothetical protein BFS86_19605 [Shewanella algae]
MAQLRYGQVLEASPAYQRAVALQRAKERERRLDNEVVQLPTYQEVKKIVETKIQEEDDKEERERLNTWLLMADYRSSNPSVAAIQEYHARENGLSVKALKGDCRLRHLVEVKYDAILETHIRRPELTLPQIAREFDKDHTSILSALRKRGVRCVPRRRFDPVEAQRLHRNGMTTDQIAKKLGFAVETIRRATKPSQAIVEAL